MIVVLKIFGSIFGTKEESKLTKSPELTKPSEQVPIPAVSPKAENIETKKVENISALPEKIVVVDAKLERSFIMIKPDGVQRHFVGKLIERFEEKGFKLVAMKLVVPSKAILEEHYAEHKGKSFFVPLVKNMSSGPVIAMVWQGTKVIEIGRKIMGKTKPVDSDPATIRGDLAIDTGKNIVHGSDSVESAQREIQIWFNKHELAEWAPESIKWIYEH